MEEENNNKLKKDFIVFAGVAIVLMFCLGFYIGGVQKIPLYKVYTVNCLLNTTGQLNIEYATRIAQTTDTPIEFLNSTIEKVKVNDVEYFATCMYR